MISASVGFGNRQGWQAKGWYRIEPADCIVPKIFIDTPTVYFYAESGNVGWQGETRFCVHPSKRFLLANSDVDKCRYTRKFSVAQTGGKSVLTYSFRCDATCLDVQSPEYFDTGPRLMVYGNWCGPGHPKGQHPGPPIDQIDQVCHDHDKNYANCSRSGDRLRCEASADLKLLEGLAKMDEGVYHNPKRLAYIAAISHYFYKQGKLKYQLASVHKMKKWALTAVNRSGDASIRWGSDVMAKTKWHIENAQKDIESGPGDSNDVTGKDGWLRKRLGI